jgi:NADPH-dependent curcumin reductase
MKQIVLKAPLAAAPTAEDFEAVHLPTPDCPADGVLAEVLHLSLDPYVGARLRGRHMGEPAPEPGSGLIPAAAIVRVVKSNSPDWAVGSLAHTMDAGWAEVVALPAAALRAIDIDGIAPRAHLGVLGMPGLTAWAGMTQLAKVTPGDVLVVDAAAGAVGGVAGQLARLKGASAVGIAGGAEKCGIVTDTYGFDACVDYKSPDWEWMLDQALPKKPSIIFENVSTHMLVTVLQRAELYARVVLCGLAGHYHADGPPATLPVGLVIGKRASLFGLVVYDFYPRWQAFVSEAGGWVRDGKLTLVEDVGHGLHAAPALMEKLMAGANRGKCVVDVTA